VANKSLRYMDAYRQGATGRLAAFANKKCTSHRCLPASWLTECMEGYEAAFSVKAEASMLDIASVTADVMGRSGLGRDLDAENLDSDVDADDEIVGNEGSKESGSGASYGEVEAEVSDVLDNDDFASSSEESDAAAEVAAARANRSTGRALSKIAVLEARAAAASSGEDGMNAQGRPVRTRTPANYAEDVQSQRWTQ
jgi:hypothetical protein